MASTRGPSRAACCEARSPAAEASAGHVGPASARPRSQSPVVARRLARRRRGHRRPRWSSTRARGGIRMKRWVPLAVLAVAALAAAPGAASAQAKDTLTVALVSHAPTLDPHMHFERVGILVNINMFDSLLHRNTKLQFEPSLATSWKP